MCFSISTCAVTTNCVNYTYSYAAQFFYASTAPVRLFAKRRGVNHRLVTQILKVVEDIRGWWSLGIYHRGERLRGSEYILTQK